MKANGQGLSIRAARAKRNLSQTDLARMAGVCLMTVHRAERTGRVSTDVAKKLARVLEEPISCHGIMRAHGFLGPAEAAGLVKPRRGGDGFEDTASGRRFLGVIKKRGWPT